MKIDQILHSASQDQRAPDGQEVFYGWKHGPSSNPSKHPFSGTVHSRELPRFSFRKESWGVLFVYGPTQGVYVADEEAFELLKRMQNGETLAYIRSNPIGVGPEKIASFAKIIDGLGFTD